MRIIPAIDIIDGKCVRLSKGDYNTKKIYNEDPVEVAKLFEDHGIEYLHVVDLDGAKSKHIINHKCLERIATKTNLKVDFGGGIKSDEDIRIAFDCGASQITGGSVAVQSPELFHRWVDFYGNDRIILGADTHNGKIALQGWMEISEASVIPFIEEKHIRNILYVICTDIDKDGMLGGPSIDLYQSILEVVPDIKLIASGGISSLDDLYRLKEIGCEGAVLGKSIYENRISLKDLRTFLS